MAALLELPKGSKPEDRSALSTAIEILLGPAIIQRNINQIGWWTTDAYLQGMRRFDVVDLNRGQLEVSYEEEDGEVHMRWEEALTMIQTEVGRLTRLDASPVAGKRLHSIESLRNASTAQIILDEQETMVDAPGLFTQFCTGVVQYGTYGIASWHNELSEHPLGITRELIPPWELLFLPAGYSNPTDRRALCRTRLFPLAQLLRQKGLLTFDEDLLDIVELPYGINTNVSGPGMEPGAISTTDDLFDEDPSDRKPGAATERRAAAAKVKPGTRTEKFIRLREIYVDGPQNTVARYIARAGRAIVKDEDYLSDNLKVPTPIGIARYQDIGRPYGRSFAGKIIPLALELEGLLERLIANMADFDRFGFLMVPTDRGIDFGNFIPGEKPRIIPYEEDLDAKGSGVDQLLPTTANDIPGRTFQFGLTILDRTTAQGPLFQATAPGRADSGAAFSTLAEMGATHLRPVAESLQSAYTQMFAFQLHDARLNFKNTDQIPDGLPLSRIENSIAGITVNSTTGRVSLDPSKMPDPFSLELKIRSSDPLGSDRRREEAPTMLQQGLLSPLEFIILNYKEGWDYPIGNRAVWENYVKAVMLNLIMFNDGEKVGQLPGANEAAGLAGVFFHESADKPEVHLLAIEDFIAGPFFSLASKEVQDAFQTRYEEVRDRMGLGNLPRGAPTLEDAAMQSAGARQQGEQGQQPQPQQPQPGA